VIEWPKHQAGTCLRVLPPHKMDQLMADIDAMPNSDPNKVVLKRVIGSKSEQVTLDKAGRICLPDAMAKAAGIKDEVLLVGLLDRFEIWNPVRYEQVAAADAVHSPKAFEIME
jgi:MraZ protein